MTGVGSLQDRHVIEARTYLRAYRVCPIDRIRAKADTLDRCGPPADTLPEIVGEVATRRAVADAGGAGGVAIHP